MTRCRRFIALGEQFQEQEGGRSSLLWLPHAGPWFRFTHHTDHSRCQGPPYLFLMLEIVGIVQLILDELAALAVSPDGIGKLQ